MPVHFIRIKGLVDVGETNGISLQDSIIKAKQKKKNCLC